MTYIIKRKLRSVLGDRVDGSDMANLLQHTQPNPIAPFTFLDKLTLNRLTVKARLKIPVGADKYDIVTAAITAQETYTAGEDTSYSFQGAVWLGQTFTPSTTHEIVYVKIKLLKTGSPTGTITVGIRATDADNKPTGSDLTSATMSSTLLTGSGVWYTLALFPKIELASGTRYAIVAHSDDTTPNNPQWRADGSAGGYAGGQTTSSADSGSSWLLTAADNMFEEGGGSITFPTSFYWTESSNLYGFDTSGVKQIYLHQRDVDDTAVDGATLAPISSNWAYDHVAAADPHTGYVLESLLDAKGDLYVASANNTPAKLTVGSNNTYPVAASGETTGIKWQTIPAADVEVSELSTATYDDVQDYINFQGDRTLFTGGGFTDNGDGTVAVAAGTGWCKETDSDTAVGRFFDFSADNSVSLTDQVTNYLYVDYNGGTPQIVVATSRTTFGFQQDHIPIGCMFRDGTTLHLHAFANLGIQGINRTHMHHIEESDGHRATGIVTSSTGTRNLAITTGVLYVGLDRTTTSPFTTPNAGTADATEANKLHDADGGFASTDVGKTIHNTTDDTYANVTAFVDSGELTLDGDIFISGENYDLDIFSYWYTADSGSTWTEVKGSTAISNTQYNDITSGLSNLTANRYGVHWVYMDFDGNHLHIVYGQGDYKANEAEEAGVPSTLPNLVTNYCVLIAKIINQEGTNTLTITYPWTEVFTSSLATDHNSLANLTTGDVHTQYIKHALATAANDFLVASGSGTYVKKTLAETLALVSPLTTRGDMMFRNASVNTRLAKGNDNTILAMGANDPEWKTPATILADLSGQAGATFDWNAQDLDKIEHIGLGNTAVSADKVIDITKTFSAITDDNARYFLYSAIELYKTEGPYAGVGTGGYFDIFVAASNTKNWTDIVGLRGVQGEVGLTPGTASPSTITGAASLYGSATVPGSANDMVLTNYYGLYIAAQTLVGNSKLPNDYGIYVASQAGGATLNYALYTNAGLVHIGDDMDFAAGKGIGAYTLGGKLTAGASEIEGSNFDINGGDISAGTISGDLTWSSTQTGVSEFTFSAFPITPSAAPDADYEVANKKYVDDNDVDATKEFFVPVTSVSAGAVMTTYNRYAAAILDNATEGAYITFFVPADFSSITDAVVLVAPKSTQAAANWDVNTAYAADGEASITHLEGITGTTYNVTNDQFFEVDISGALTSLAANDYVGITFTQEDNAHDVNVLGVRFKYS